MTTGRRLLLAALLAIAMTLFSRLFGLYWTDTDNAQWGAICMLFYLTYYESLKDLNGEEPK